MPFNILILPLLGGYFFVTHWNRTKHPVRRQDGRRLLFESALYGVFLLIPAFAIVLSVEYFTCEISELWSGLIPFDYSGTSVIAFMLGWQGWRPLNSYYDENGEIKRAIKKNDDYLEALIEQAINENKLVSATTSRGKVYIGEPVGNFLPSGERKYIKILPQVSGYRDPTTQKLEPTTWYFPVYDKIEQGAYGDDLTENDLAIVFPVNELHNISLFSEDAYGLFQSQDMEIEYPQSSSGNDDHA